jgi:Cof subfamily protein (haloacid dehalogenase superfamily)
LKENKQATGAPLTLHTIVSDLDGTVLPKTFRVSDRTVEAFRLAQSLGIRTILASGRSGASMRPHVARIGSIDPYIACNGAQTFDASGKLLREITIDVRTAHNMLRFLKERAVYTQVYYGDDIYYEDEGVYAQEYRESSGVVSTRVPDLIALVNSPTVKILGVAESARIPALIAEAQSLYSGTLSITTSEPWFFEVSAIGATKGSALASLADTLGFAREGTLAIGDSLNDLSMIEWAGMGVAIGNARDEIRQCAWRVADVCDADGAARLIEELIAEGYRP